LISIAPYPVNILDRLFEQVELNWSRIISPVIINSLVMAISKPDLEHIPCPFSGVKRAVCLSA